MADLYLPKDEIRENRAEKPLQRLLDPYTRGSCLMNFLGAVCLTSLYSPILTGTPEPQHAIRSSAL